MKRVALIATACLFMQFHAVSAHAGTVLAVIDLRSQTMTVSEDGAFKYRWRVSTARRGYVTPLGSYTAKWLSRDHRSKKYDDAPMPYAVFFNGGYAVHGTYEVRRLGRPASHGCVRLDTRNAATFFAMASDVGLHNTRIVISD
ncbi:MULTISPECIES: L,D-transpeptidase [unclassified Rhizobium]|uniref:L,D-transpeptidase n=1 Tax=unclassified Rhizobium TaxID=2613769 RepID=UPI000EA92780|nr:MULTISPECIES: L,D-transpeptidase [unclassified Rhizobium]AYG66544.1 L,D-transpeptidase [Rhizobium sp. CCGE531]AYG72925.1 L,D-transpeptidase [Rhizobium sp. CCGE532]